MLITPTKQQPSYVNRFLINLYFGHLGFVHFDISAFGHLVIWALWYRRQPFTTVDNRRHSFAITYNRD